jgi:hypothetical protein
MNDPASLSHKVTKFSIWAVVLLALILLIIAGVDLTSGKQQHFPGILGVFFLQAIGSLYLFTFPRILLMCNLEFPAIVTLTILTPAALVMASIAMSLK